MEILPEEDRRERQAARRAEQLPEPEEMLALGRAGLIAVVPAAVLCFLGSSLVMTAIVLFAVAENADRPRQGSDGLVLTAQLLGVGGLLLTALAIAAVLFALVQVIRLVRGCRDVVFAAAPRQRTPLLSVNPDLSGWARWLGIGGIDTPALPDLASLVVLVGRPGGVWALMMLLGLVVMTVFLTLVPLCVCLIKPGLMLQMLFLVVLLVVYAVVHSPVVVLLLFSINRNGYGLNAVIDIYRLYEVRVPWAPIGLGFWTAISAFLILAGPFSPVFFLLLALWIRSTRETAVLICSLAARERIAAGVPPELEKPLDEVL